MPLRYVHLGFISAATVLALGVGAWSIGAWMEEGGSQWAALAAVGLIGAGGLVVYGTRFFRKIRGLGIVALMLGLLLGAPAHVLACPACVGTTDSPLATGMNLGILTLVGVTVTMLLAMGAFFVHLARRARRTPVLAPRRGDA